MDLASLFSVLGCCRLRDGDTGVLQLCQNEHQMIETTRNLEKALMTIFPTATLIELASEMYIGAATGAIVDGLWER
jgi:hypothetical protein